MSNRKQRNNARNRCTALLASLQRRSSHAMRRQALKLPTVDQQMRARHVHQTGGVVAELAKTPAGYTFPHFPAFSGNFPTRAAALRGALLLGITHVFGSGCLKGEQDKVRAIRARYSVA